MKLSRKDIFEKLNSHFADIDLQWLEAQHENADAAVLVPADKVLQVVQYLKESSDLSMDFLMSVSAFDGLKWEDEGEGDYVDVTYHFYSYEWRHDLVLKARPKRNGGTVDSLYSLYGAADFQEREVYDHFGIQFKGHPNLKRILLPDDWVGYPLLKDYEEQEEYNGIATTRPSMLN